MNMGSKGKKMADDFLLKNTAYDFYANLIDSQSEISSEPQQSNIEQLSVADAFEKAATLSNVDFTSVRTNYKDLNMPQLVLFKENEEILTLKPLIHKEEVFAPNFNEIKNSGAIMKLGDKGTFVKLLQQKLNKLGYNIKDTGNFDIYTENTLKKFQASHGVTKTGILGATTLDAIYKAEQVQSLIKKPTRMGKLLAKAAQNVASTTGTIGRCFSGVATSLEKVYGNIVDGRSAYMAADQLAQNKKFTEVKIKNNELAKLPAGAVVVWGKTPVSPHGHISIALGNGTEASDHVAKQLTELRGYTNFRVFIPT